MLQVLAERMRDALEAAGLLSEYVVLAEGEDARTDMPDDAPLVVLETRSVSPGVPGVPGHPCRKLEGEMVLSVAAAHPRAAKERSLHARRVLGAVLGDVLRAVRDKELSTPDGGLCYSVAGWTEGWGAMETEGALYGWRLPFVWVVVE